MENDLTKIEDAIYFDFASPRLSGAKTRHPKFYIGGKRHVVAGRSYSGT